MPSRKCTYPPDLLPEWSKWIHYFIDYCEYKALSVNTLAYYHGRLIALARWLQQERHEATPVDITPQLIRRFLMWESTTHSRKTARHSYITLNVFFKCLEMDEIRPDSPMRKVERPKVPERIIPSFSNEQVAALLKTADKSTPREKALIYLMMDTGARASEVCGIRVSQVDFASRTAIVIRKGNKEDTLYFSVGTARAIQLYIAQHDLDDDDHLFYCDRGGPLNRASLAKVVTRLCRRAGIQGVRTSPHTLRHTYATQAIKSGMDVFSLQRLMCHRDLSTTRQYIDLDGEHLRAAQDRHSLVMSVKRSRR